MLNLETWVHLDKVEVLILIYQELNCTCVAVLYLACNLDCVLAKLIPELVRDSQGWSELDNLLVSSLDGAVTLEEVNDVSIVIAHDLDFDVLWTLKIFLKEYCAVAECSLSLALCSLNTFKQLLLIVGNSHSSTTATCSSLYYDRISAAFCELKSILCLLDREVCSWYNWNAGLDSCLSCCNLVTKGSLLLCGWSDKYNSCLFTSLGEIRVLGKESVSRMDGIYILLKCKLDNLINSKISINRALSLSYKVGFVCFSSVKRQPVLVGINSHCLKSKFATSSESSDGNLASVGRHYLFKLSNSHNAPL